VLRHIRLLIFDLDYVVFDCAQLKAQALRQSLISLADLIPQDAALPGRAEAESGFLDHGSRWIQHLEMGLDEESLNDIKHAYTLHESRLIESGNGRIYPGVGDFITQCKRADIAVALGADASRDYLVSVVDRYQLDSLFQVALCTEEFGMGDAEEMMLEIMRQIEVNPSETLMFGTRAYTFQIARALDIGTIGCGWGIQQHTSLAESNLQSRTLSDLAAAVKKADNLALQHLD